MRRAVIFAIFVSFLLPAAPAIAMDADALSGGAQTGKPKQKGKKYKHDKICQEQLREVRRTIDSKEHEIEGYELLRDMAVKNGKSTRALDRALDRLHSEWLRLKANEEDLDEDC